MPLWSYYWYIDNTSFVSKE